ncbi:MULTISPECIES: hypothetical protein [Trichocoleus]|uniref:Uncharacterized protein n=1 Tax=Trichocoleus desertorum GB2-A4 TaxID=2933944 RepID=A0ABV0JHA7_9CYAN|nr:hypothetical protein [Trichocoleus sp. FACHB-46]MBD1865702.1 hypothetical protein [Trichocoleus sp. FACHB-46]
MQFWLVILLEAICGSIVGAVAWAYLIAALAVFRAKTDAHSGYIPEPAADKVPFSLETVRLIGSIVAPLLSTYLIWIGMPLSYVVIGSVLLAAWSVVLCPDFEDPHSSWFIPSAFYLPCLPLCTVLASIRELKSKMTKGL